MRGHDGVLALAYVGHAGVDGFFAQMSERVQARARLAHAFHFLALAPGGQAESLRFVVLGQAAKGVLRAHFQKVAYAVPAPCRVHAFGPANGIFIQIRDMTADGRLVVGVKFRGDAAHGGVERRVHFKRIEAAQRKVAQHAHAWVVEGQAHVEYDGRYAPLAQAFAGLGQDFARPAQDELLGAVVVGNIESRPCGACFVNDLGAGVNGHHAGLARGGGLQIGHMHGAGVDYVPGHFRVVEAAEAQGDQLAQAVPAEQRGPQTEGGQDAPLRKLKHEEVGRLPAREADFFNILFIHKAEHIPVGHCSDAVHGGARHRKIVVQFAAHAGPYRTKTTAHDGKGRGLDLRRKPDAASFEAGQVGGVGIVRQGKQFLPPKRIGAPHAPHQAVLGQVCVAHAVQNKLFRQSFVF